MSQCIGCSGVAGGGLGSEPSMLPGHLRNLLLYAPVNISELEFEIHYRFAEAAKSKMSWFDDTGMDWTDWQFPDAISTYFHEKLRVVNQFNVVRGKFHFAQGIKLGRILLMN